MWVELVKIGIGYRKVDCRGGLQIEVKRRNVFENRQQT